MAYLILRIKYQDCLKILQCSKGRQVFAKIGIGQVLTKKTQTSAPHLWFAGYSLKDVLKYCRALKVTDAALKIDILLVLLSYLL